MATHPLEELGFEPLPQQPPPARRAVKGTVVKGARVRLADGTVARVVWVDTQMRIARVRTVDGKNITVRHNSLRGSAG
jgi:hypothetical protein